MQRRLSLSSRSLPRNTSLTGVGSIAEDTIVRQGAFDAGLPHTEVIHVVAGPVRLVDAVTAIIFRKRSRLLG